MLRNYSSVCPPWSYKEVLSNTGSRDDLHILCSCEKNSFVNAVEALNMAEGLATVFCRKLVLFSGVKNVQ